MAVVRRCSTETLYLLTVLLSTNVKRNSLLFSIFINNISTVTLVFNSCNLLIIALKPYIFVSHRNLKTLMEGGISPVALRNGVERSEVEEVGETGRKYQAFREGGPSKGDIIDPEAPPST